MKTEHTTDPNVAAEFINIGGIVAFPTETVYGLGGSVFSRSAIARIYEAKRRPADNPLIAHVAKLSDINLLARAINHAASRFIAEFFPGPLTIVLKKSESVPLIATAGLETVGVRMPSLPLAHEFLLACDTPVVAPSANFSGKPSPTTWMAVTEDLDGEIDCILHGEPSQFGLESTVVDCTDEVPLLLRKGAISIEQLRAIESTTIPFTIGSSDALKSPGLRHKHYSPRAKVEIIEKLFEIPSRPQIAFIGLTQPTDLDNLAHFRVCATIKEYAHFVFEFFRECDRRNIETIYCERVPEIDIGSALMDRLRRSSE